MDKDIIKELGFGESVEAVEGGLCPFCQQCQDSIFGKTKKKYQKK
jgi:hypothetical protein